MIWNVEPSWEGTRPAFFGASIWLRAIHPKRHSTAISRFIVGVRSLLGLAPGNTKA
jgi:hypothetical protein